MGLTSALKFTEIKDQIKRLPAISVAREFFFSCFAFTIAVNPTFCILLVLDHEINSNQEEGKEKKSYTHSKLRTI